MQTETILLTEETDREQVLAQVREYRSGDVRAICVWDKTESEEKHEEAVGLIL